MRTHAFSWLWLLVVCALVGVSDPLAAQDLSKAEKDRKSLYKRFLPKSADLGSGWLLPWQLPQPLRRYESEAAYWKAVSGTGPAAPDDVQPVVSRLVYGGAGTQKKTMAQWVKQAQGEITADDLPPGEAWDTLVVAPALLTVHLQTSPSLRHRLALTASYLERAQTLMGQMMAQEGLSVAGSGGGPSARAIVSELEESIVANSDAIRRFTAMTYYKSSNWDEMARAGQILEGEDTEEIIGQVDIGVVNVALLILDRDKMNAAVDDLQSDDIAAFRDDYNSRMRGFRDFAFAAMRESERADLTMELEETTDEAERAVLQEQLASLDARYDQLMASTPSMEIEVYQRDFGDNCYVANMGGVFDMPTMQLPVTTLNASLRNGTAIAFIAIGGSFTADQKKAELDVFLSELDSKTAFFRE